MQAIWRCYESLWTAEACEQVIELGKRLPMENAKLGNEHGQSLEDDWRRSKVGWAYPNNRDWEDVYEELNLIFHEANEYFRFDLGGIPEIQFTEYDSSYKGHYDWHIDTGWLDVGANHRKLTAIVQLTDETEYSGGEFELDCLTFSEPLPEKVIKQGTVFVFPSFLRHKVNPVENGTRRSLVAWMEGPKFR